MSVIFSGKWYYESEFYNHKVPERHTILYESIGRLLVVSVIWIICSSISLMDWIQSMIDCSDLLGLIECTLFLINWMEVTRLFDMFVSQHLLGLCSPVLTTSKFFL